VVAQEAKPRPTRTINLPCGREGNGCPPREGATGAPSKRALKPERKGERRGLKARERAKRATEPIAYIHFLGERASVASERADYLRLDLRVGIICERA